MLLSPCFSIYPFYMTVFSSLFLDLLSTNFSFFLLHFFVSLRSLHFSLYRDASSKNSSWFLFNNAFLLFFLLLSFFPLISIPRRQILRKYFLKFFHIRRCCHIALPFIFSPWPFRLLSSLIFFRQISPSSCCIFSSIFYRCIFLLITMPRQKILLLSTTFFYDVSVHCRFFCWLRSFVDKVFVIIFCNFSISDVTVTLFLHLSFLHDRFFLLSFSIFFRQTFPSSCCIFSSVFDRYIFLFIAMPRRKIPLDSSSTLFYDSSFYCRSFRWFRSLVDKFFVSIFWSFFTFDVAVTLLYHLSFHHGHFVFFLP